MTPPNEPSRSYEAPSDGHRAVLLVAHTGRDLANVRARDLAQRLMSAGLEVRAVTEEADPRRAGP